MLYYHHLQVAEKFMDRYSRHILLSEIGQIGQDKLSKAKVLVVGAGGLGCPVLQYLTSAGVGTIGIIDFDVVETSNLQRQVLFGLSSIGKNKATAAKERLTDLNNEISIIAYAEKLTYKNTLQLFEKYDIIVDGSDNFETRYLVNDGCIITNKPLIFGAIYKFEGQVSVFNYQNGPTYRCLFPKPPKKGSILNCSEIGVLGVLPGIIGSMQANEVLKIILGIGHVLSGKLLCYNALTLKNTTLKINKLEKNIWEVLNNKSEFKSRELLDNCDIEIPEVSIKNILFKKNIQFVDLRESDEKPKIEVLKIINIPLNSLESNLNKLDKTKEIVLFCQSGNRSRKAVSVLKKHHLENCYSIKEGALEINNYIKKHHKTVGK